MITVAYYVIIIYLDKMILHYKQPQVRISYSVILRDAIKMTRSEDVKRRGRPFNCLTL